MRVIFKRNNDFLLVSADQIFHCNLETGKEQSVKVSTPALKHECQENIESMDKESRNITSLQFSSNNELIAVSTSNKWVVIYDCHFHIIKSFLVNRVVSKMCFTESNDIVLADKTGDVYLYKFEGNKIESTFLLGHRSIILDMVLTTCGKYIITCDRDEKIRVSHFPNAYNIVGFCLGHTQFVTHITLAETVLVSASGDGTIRFWNFLKGQQLGIIDTNQYIKDANLLNQFIKQIEKEKVEIEALPVADMQTHLEKDILYIAVSVYGSSAVFLFKVLLDKLFIELVATYDLSNPFTFLMSNFFYIFSNNVIIESYKQACEDNRDITILKKFYNKYCSLVDTKDDNEFVSLLYKRKFDNVQEYLERKKQRLEIK